METKLNQIVAVVNGKKTRFQKAITEVYHILQKNDLFNGLTRKYTPLNEDGETYPSETTLPKANAIESIKNAKQLLVELIDVIATQDYNNCAATANIIIDDQVIIEDVPVTHLLYLEKQLVDLHTFIEKLPTLDPAEQWKWDDTQNYFVSNPVKTNKTKKVLRNHVKAEATEHHPAQVEVYTEDVKIGEWTTTKFSTSIKPSDKAEYLQRVRKLQDAIRQAREAANNLPIKQVKIGEKLLDYVIKS